MRHWETLRRMWQESGGSVLGVMGLACLFEAASLGWRAHLGLQQHLKPGDIIEWTSRPRGGYAVSQYTLSELIRAAFGYLLGGVAALLALARRHGVRLQRSSEAAVKPHTKCKRRN